MQYPPTSDSSGVPAPPPVYVTGDESSQRERPAPRFDGSQACYGVDQGLFFPPQGNGAARAVQAAKKLCAGCSFLTPCREYSIAAQGTPGRYVSGVWGGTTETERTAIRRERRSLAVAA